VYLSFYTSKQRNFNGYIYVFYVKQLDWTDLTHFYSEMSFILVTLLSKSIILLNYY